MKKQNILLALSLMTLWALPLLAEDVAAPELKVDVAVGTAMENRKLVGTAETFPASTPQLIGWSRIVGAKEPTEIKHIWKVDGKEVSTVTLPVQSSSFRTHSRKSVNGRSGKWTFEVRDLDGHLLASKDFVVQ